jgi:hypothetical protein
MLNNPAILMWSLLFGAFGLGYFMYGRRQRSPVPFVTGIALMVFPYFVANVYVLVLVGVGLIAAPYFIRLD